MLSPTIFISAAPFWVFYWTNWNYLSPNHCLFYMNLSLLWQRKFCKFWCSLKLMIKLENIITFSRNLHEIYVVFSHEMHVFFREIYISQLSHQLTNEMWLTHFQIKNDCELFHLHLEKITDIFKIYYFFY